jgi:hypothetical protein
MWGVHTFYIGNPRAVHEYAHTFVHGNNSSWLVHFRFASINVYFYARAVALC